MNVLCSEPTALREEVQALTSEERIVVSLKKEKEKKRWPCLRVDVQREGNGFVATLRPLPLDEKSRVELRRDHTPSSTYRSALLSSGTVG